MAFVLVAVWPKIRMEEKTKFSFSAADANIEAIYCISTLEARIRKGGQNSPCSQQLSVMYSLSEASFQSLQVNFPLN